MNFNPQESGSLELLLNALRAGLPGNTGYGIMQDVLGQQQQRVQQRQGMLQNLVSNLTNAAQQGGSYQGAQAMANAMVPGQGLPPMVGQALNALYPAQDTGAIYNSPGPNQYQPIMQRSPMQQSVVAPTPSPTDQLAQMQAQQALQQGMQTGNFSAGPAASPSYNQQGLQMLMQAIAVMKAQQLPPDQIVAKIKSDPEAAAILATNFTNIVQIYPDLMAALTGG